MRHETEFKAVSPDELARIGAGHIAYLRQLAGSEITKAFPNLVDIDPDLQVWALFAADGTPIAITDDAGGALSTAFQNNLLPVAVH